MKWNHLPEAGGLYDQNPEMLEKFYYIFGKQSEWDEKEQKRQQAESKRGARNPRHR